MVIIPIHDLANSTLQTTLKIGQIAKRIQKPRREFVILVNFSTICYNLGQLIK